MLLKVAAAYIRVSTERQDEYSPDSQLKLAREKAGKDGYIIPDEYVFYDDGISGRSAKKRNEFNRMIATAKEKSHPFEAIYVWKFSRFARNQEEAIVYKNLLRKYNVSVVSVSEPIPEGHFGTLIERIIEWMDEFYSINLSAEVTRGMTEKVQRGEPVCPPAFGYDIKDKNYYVNKEQAQIVLEVFSRYAQGEGLRTITVDLGKRGIKTKRGNTPDNRYFEYMLNNPLYIGKLRWSVGGTQAVHNRKYLDESVLVIDGHHEPIIPIELWEKVQARLRAEKIMNAKYAKKGQSVHVMLKGLVRCSSCGSTLIVSNVTSGKAKTPTLQCHKYCRGQCHVSHSVTVTKLEKALIDGLKQAVETKNFTISPKKREVIKSDTPDYDKLIAIEERKIQRAKDAYLAGIDGISQYAANKAEIEKRIAELVELRDKEAQEEPVNLSLFSKKVLDVVRFIEREDASTEAKNEALRTIIDKIIYDKANAGISIFFHDI